MQRVVDSVALMTSAYHEAPQDLCELMQKQERTARAFEAAYLAGDTPLARKLLMEVVTLQGQVEHAERVVGSMIHCRRAGIEDLDLMVAPYVE